ncbi:MAG TPA: flagellin, partial [Phycisphaerales bacterium]|nr:flagellin [Phycisphaerales bacterium]
NRGADNPAGLIISERLRAEISGLNQAVSNSERASSVIATAEGSLAEVGDLLNSIKALVVEASNTGALSDAERTANQLQIDSAIESITRISNSTSFGGLKLLNGELDYVLSGLVSADISKAQVHGANFAGQANVRVDVDVVASAQTANLYMRGDYPAAPAMNGRLLSSLTLEIAGSNGVQVLQFLSGQLLSDVAAAINSFTEGTGVKAALINPANAASGLVFSSASFGSDAFVSVKRLSDSGDFFQTFELANNASVPATFSFSDAALVAQLTPSNDDHGRDVSAVVNGTLGTGKGLSIALHNSTSLSIELLLDQDFATANNSTSTFYITGGGALYQLGGEINASQQINIGIASIAASRLGGTLIGDELHFLSSLKSGGANDLNSRNFASASDILQAATDEVAIIRGRLGAFERNTLQTNVRSLQTAVENLTASESTIRDADFAKETTALTRAQILTTTATSVLGLANQQSQQVLQLLG